VTDWGPAGWHRRRLHTASGQRGERVVNSSFRVKTVPELIANAKANPGKRCPLAFVPPPARCGMFRAKQWREPLDPVSNLINWCRRERESLQMQREMLLSGKFHIFKNEGSGQVDVSSQIIEQIATNIAELDQFLVDYDAKSSHAPRS
jgi:hypothetical protein